MPVFFYIFKVYSDIFSNTMSFNQIRPTFCPKLNSSRLYKDVLQWFFEKSHDDRISFNCPKVKSKTIDGVITPINTCKSPCSDAKWGRKVNIPIDYNYRFNPFLPRASKKRKNHFKTRPVFKRSINQFKQCINLDSSFVRKTESFKADVFFAPITQVISALILIRSNKLEHILSIKSLAS